MVDIESGATPVESFIQLLTIWYNCYMDLLKQNSNIQVQYLEEPLARINFILYLGVHKIRDKYVCDYQILDEICTLLLNSTLQGLFFLESHSYIAEVLGNFMEDNFGTSKAFDEDALKFFYKAFQVEKQKATQCNTLKCLTRIMNKISTEEETSSYRNFFSFLIEMPMLRIYFTLLKMEKTKRLKLAILNFLNNLQEKLLDLDCFSLVFLEAILALTLHTDENISFLAAELYVIMARRKASGDDMLLKHILEFYLKEIKSVDLLPRYVNALWSNFTYMQSMHIYFDLTKATDVPLVMRYFIAQFTIVVYRKMLKAPEKFARQIKYVFQTSPTLFRELESQCVKGILLQLYSSTELELLRDSAGTMNEFLFEFEDYFISVITKDTTLIYPYLLNLFIQFTCCIEETKNFDKLEICAIQIYQKYEDLERTLKRLDDESKMPSVKNMNAYNSILQKLNVLLQVDYVVFDTLEQLIKTLHVRLIEKSQICELAQKHEIFIDVHATELLVNSCIKLSYNEDLTKTAQTWLAQEIRILEGYLLRRLTNAEAKTDAQMLRLKTYFICLANLYYIFDNASGMYKLSLNLRSYHIMVEALLLGCLRLKATSITKSAIVSEENMLLHTKYILQYQKSMFSKFTQLHSSADIVIPSAVAWKVCLHYGLSSHKFNGEILSFMEALTKHHFKGFTHISAVLVYNLYKQRTETKVDDIKRVIHAQKFFIDQLPPALSPTLLCVNVVLKVLQLLQQSLKVLSPTTGGNRLAALKHLNHYINNLNVNSDNVLPDIREQAYALQNHMLNNAEQTYLKSYLSELDEYDKNKEEA
ncbi:uncharacterized protein LOC101448850 isoform X3 [Ceratitis capitata]|nr:uncharacterized protein LOC101448850 isoform X3 [Ceratitis capitata]